VRLPLYVQYGQQTERPAESILNRAIAERDSPSVTFVQYGQKKRDEILRGHNKINIEDSRVTDLFIRL